MLQIFMDLSYEDSVTEFNKCLGYVKADTLALEAKRCLWRAWW